MCQWSTSSYLHGRCDFARFLSQLLLKRGKGANVAANKECNVVSSALQRHHRLFLRRTAHVLSVYRQDLGGGMRGGRLYPWLPPWPNLVLDASSLIPACPASSRPPYLPGHRA